MHVIIFADNKYQTDRLGILRAPGAHRIATHLRTKNIKTEVIDFYLDWTLDELKQIIDYNVSDQTLFVAFSCSLMFSGVEGFNLIRDYVKSKHPTVPIVIGGNKTLQKGFDGADYYMEGAGEYAVTALVDHLIDPTQPLKYTLVDGNKVINTLKDYPVVSLSSLDIQYTASDFISADEVLAIETARGCIFKCKFCDFPLIGKSKLDYLRDMDEIINEYTYNYKTYGTTRYFVVEDTINDSEEKVEMLLEISKKLPFKLELMGYMRADLLAAKPHTIAKLVDAGFKAMHFGIETFNERAGQIIGKGMNPNKMKENLVSIKRAHPNLFLNSTFIVGLPYETKEEINATVDWIIGSKALDFWSFNPLMIPKHDETVYHSYFTDNYRLYGYTPFNEEERNNYEKQIDKFAFGLKWFKNIILWKNKNFDSVTAAEFTNDINQRSNPYKKVDAWTAFAISGLGYNIDDIFQKTYNGENLLDQELLKQQTGDFVKKYKIKKLEYLKNNQNDRQQNYISI